jgi:hypothetical protein
MTRHRIAQIGENRNPKSPENRPQTRRFLQKRLFQTRCSAARLNGVAVLHGRLTMLEVACHRCERRGGVSLARLIEEHGADMGLPYLWESLAGDCPNAHTTALHSRCAIYYPQLPALFLPGKET